jgi:hypothetical protein
MTKFVNDVEEELKILDSIRSLLLKMSGDGRKRALPWIRNWVEEMNATKESKLSTLIERKNRLLHDLEVIDKRVKEIKDES